ncbi:MAG: ATPase, T2SS/T4P/T4SS family, partial [Paracoccaceae bacterium]
MNPSAEKTSFLSTYLKPLAAPIADPCVVEIAVNPDGKVWVETRGAEHMVGLEGVFFSPSQARDLATSIASATHGQISEKKPLVSGKIEMNGKPIRAQVVYPPGVDGGPSITLRRYS